MIEISREMGQSYSTVDLSKADVGIVSQFKKEIYNAIDAKYYCVYAFGSVMLINTAMLNGLFESGTLNAFRKYINQK